VAELRYGGVASRNPKVLKHYITPPIHSKKGGRIMEMEKAKVHQFLRSLNGKFFTIEFTKRTTGEVRVMRATTNYQSKLAGGDLGYDANEKALIPVWDLEKKAFRSIPTDAVLRIVALGNTYEVK